MSVELKHIEVGAGAAQRRLAVRVQRGDAPGLFWLGGFKSDMRGTKAEALAGYAARTGRAFVRFDYSGHGESGGRFEDGTISRWLEEALAVFTAEARGPQIVIGSSMGGWIALLLARALSGTGSPGAKLAGMVLIAPAPDFTEELMWAQFSPDIRRQIEQEGRWQRPSVYGEEPYPITRALIEDGRKHLLLNRPIEVGCPVRVLQGVKDPDVPYSHAMKLVCCLAQDDVALTLVKDGDHRLSRPEDVERLIRTVDELVANL